MQLAERVSHDANVVQFYGAAAAPHAVLLVMEFMQVGPSKSCSHCASGHWRLSSTAAACSQGKTSAACGRQRHICASQDLNCRVLLQGGDLRAALDGSDARQYRWHARGARIAADIARGLAYIHSTGIVHM